MAIKTNNAEDSKSSFANGGTTEDGTKCGGTRRI
jgi:hypothetical protein